MTSASRRQRANATVNLVAAYLVGHGWPYAQAVGSGRGGVDITGVPGLSVEVKARRDLALPAWLREAAGRQGLPLVIHRPDGFGAVSLESWPVTMRLVDAVELLRAAGYGNPLAGTFDLDLSADEVAP